jgi:hypothetical protein
LLRTLPEENKLSNTLELKRKVLWLQQHILENVDNVNVEIGFDKYQYGIYLKVTKEPHDGDLLTITVNYDDRYGSRGWEYWIGAKSFRSLVEVMQVVKSFAR